MPRTNLALVRTWRERGVGGCQNTTAAHHLEVWSCKISARSNYMCCQRWGLLKRIFMSVASRARGNTCKRRTGPPQNMWCFSVVFHVATCEVEIAKTGRQSISKDGIGRSHQDLAIRSLGSRVNPAFAPNTAVYARHKNATHKSGPCSGAACSGSRRMPKQRCAPFGGMLLQDLDEI